MTKFYSLPLFLVILLFLTACGNGFNKRGGYRGHFKVGKTYEIKGKKYTPKRVSYYQKIGIASWYGKGDGFHGKQTANGDKYNKNMLTAAHKTLPMPSLVKVTNLKNNKSVIVMVNDRGPFSGNREIDVSEKAALILDFKRQGTATVKVEYLHRDSMKLVHKLGLKTEEGSTAPKPLTRKKCDVNCHLKSVNLKYNQKIQL